VSYLHHFDVAEHLHTRCLVGPYRGEEARFVFYQVVAKIAPPAVWNVSFENSEGIEYGFAGAFLGPILSKCGSGIGRSNIVVVVSGQHSADRSQLLKGLVWEEGDTKWPLDVEWLRVLAEKERYCVFCASAKKFGPGGLEYLGTTEKELHLLKFLEDVPEATVDDVEKALKWKTADAVHRLEEISRRRQVLVLPQEAQNERYMSVAQALKGGDKYD
jgi:hypothetical protein